MGREHADFRPGGGQPGAEQGAPAEADEPGREVLGAVGGAMRRLAEGSASQEVRRGRGGQEEGIL